MYLVTGGYTGARRLASTEILTRRDEAARWTEAGALPVASTGLRAVSLQNKILVTGNKPLELPTKFCKIFTIFGDGLLGPFG